MGVRNCGELGMSLQKIINRLLANDNLVNLLYYSDKDPLNSPPLTKEEKQTKVFGELIRIIPRVGPKEDAKSLITLRVTKGAKLAANSEFKSVRIQIEVFVPMQLITSPGFCYPCPVEEGCYWACEALMGSGHILGHLLWQTGLHQRSGFLLICCLYKCPP